MFRFSKLILLLLSLLLLSGCWDRQELNEIAIVVGIGIDKADDGDVVVSVQIVNPGNVSTHQVGGTQSAPVITYTEKGKSIMEVFRRLTTISPRKLYLSHTRVVIIGEEAAKDGIAPLLDYLARDHEMRTDFYMMVSHEVEAFNVLEVTTLMDRIPANKLHKSLDTASSYWAPIGKITIDKVIEDIASSGHETVLTGIDVLGDIEKGSHAENINNIALRTLLQFDEMAAFKDDQLVGWLNEEQSMVYRYVTGDVQGSLTTIPCKEGEGSIGLEVKDAKSKIKGYIQNDKPAANVKVTIEANVAELMCNLELSSAEVIKDIEKHAEQYLQEKMINSIKLIQSELGTDIYGFGEAIHRANPRYWRKNEPEWDMLYKDMNVDVQVKVSIKNIGGYSKYIIQEEEQL